jgi:hypothetical protein
MRRVVGARVLALASACGDGAPREMPQATGLPVTFGSDTDDGDDGGDEGSTSPDNGDGTTESDAGDDADSAAPKLDVAAGEDTGSACSPTDDICCLEEGELPPHALLDAFLAAYPPANMPKTVPQIEAFSPMANGQSIAWHEANSGGEIIDPIEGGVNDENILEGLGVSRHAAEMVLPAAAIVLEVREEPVKIENPGNDDECLSSTGATGSAGIGWAWGSILFEAGDQSIREVVYLYIGFCVGTQDNEAFFYSDEAAEICAPPG